MRQSAPSSGPSKLTNPFLPICDPHHVLCCPSDAAVVDGNRQVLDIECALAEIKAEKGKALAETVAAEKRAASAEIEARVMAGRIKNLEADLRNVADRLEDRASLLAEIRSAAA